MKGKNLLVILAVMLLVPVLAFAQYPGQSNPKGGYLGWDDEAQSRNLPAGTVQDPASQLTYVVDTGVNLREYYGAELQTVTADPVTGATRSPAASPLAQNSLLRQFITDAAGNYTPSALYQNFLSISNVHPTQAVTVHFRYYNDNCEDLLDFLVVLTCNDTLIFDPFDFVIPFAEGENTRYRLIGYPATESHALTPIPSYLWGSGRFVITAAASATTRNADDWPDILFPYEWRSYDEDCNIETNGSLSDTAPNIPGLDAKIGSAAKDVQTARNVGSSAGFSPNNLHVFNAFQATFNYLIGHLTTAIPAEQSGFDLVSYGYPAWGRPVIDRGFDENQNDEGFANDFTMQNPTSNHERRNPNGAPVWPNPDGDGSHDFTFSNLSLLQYRIVWGGEQGRLSDGSYFLGSNSLFLRNEVHGGDIAALNYPNATMPAYQPDNVNQASPVAVTGGADSWYGAIGTSAFLGTAPEDQWIHFLSVADDYNGSNNTPATSTSLRDAAANISPAVTTYVLQIYDNDENILSFDTPPGVPVSPPNIQAASILKITCICLRTFRNFRDLATNRDQFNGSGNLDELSLDELNDFGENINVFGKNGNFRGLLVPLNNWADGSADISGGWIRFVRDNTVRVYVPRDAGTSVDTFFSSGYGTSTFNVPVGPNGQGFADHNYLGPYGASFMTIGVYVAQFEGFGVSWYLWAVASDPLVSEFGDETPPGADEVP